MPLIELLVFYNVNLGFNDLRLYFALSSMDLFIFPLISGNGVCFQHIALLQTRLQYYEDSLSIDLIAKIRIHDFKYDHLYIT